MSQEIQYTEPEHSILVVDDDPAFLDGARRALLSNNIKNVTTLSDSTQVIRALSTGAHTVLLLDWVMPELSGADLLPEIVRLYPDIPVIIITGVSDVENVVSCIKLGAYDYLTKPLDTARLVSIVQNAVHSSELVVRNRKLTGYLLGEPLSCPDNFKEVITCSHYMNSIFKVIETLACSRQPVLITGETGVGKELIAQSIHRCSGLKGKMVTVNAAGLDDTMLADTLFGHKKGAYTGAAESREGLIEQAKGGTLFLDEIGDLSIPSQIKLLRLIQQSEYYRLGSDVLHKSDARIICASNGDFQALMGAGTFRRDLYYRISAQSLHIPPLRERREDIIPLIDHYVRVSSAMLGRLIPLMSRDLRKSLLAFDFPGNVRELINMVHSAVNYNRSGVLEMEDFPGLIANNDVSMELVRKVGNYFSLNGIFQEFPTIDEVEALLVEEALNMAEGNRSVAAKMLGLSRPTLKKKIERFAGGKHHDDDED